MQCPSSSIRSCILTLAGNSVRGRKRSERPRVLTQESRGANRPGFSNIYIYISTLYVHDIYIYIIIWARGHLFRGPVRSNL